MAANLARESNEALGENKKLGHHHVRPFLTRVRARARNAVRGKCWSQGSGTIFSTCIAARRERTAGRARSISGANGVIVRQEWLMPNKA